MTVIPSVREVPAADLEPGMRLEYGGTWQPPVHSVTTWGPGKDEAPSYPNIWWTRVTLRSADGRLQDRVFQPSHPVRVVEQVACRRCSVLTPVAAAVTARHVERRFQQRPTVELFDLCPKCAAPEPIGA